MTHFQIRVPATSANIGPGFDSIGVALNRYLTLHVESSTQWQIEHRSTMLPENVDVHDHFIINIAHKVSQFYKRKLSPCHITIDSDIPLARGLGSSASAVLAGIELANQLCHLQLSEQEKLKLATRFEGHPDNVAPALYGDFVLSFYHEANETIDIVTLDGMNIYAVAYIPPFELSTETARKILPEKLSLKTATQGSALSNLMIAALLKGNYEQAGYFIEQDVFHEPYRKQLLPQYELIRQEAKREGAYGTFISGAGPTMISFVSKADKQRLIEHMKEVIPVYDVVPLNIDRNGLQVQI